MEKDKSIIIYSDNQNKILRKKKTVERHNGLGQSHMQKDESGVQMALWNMETWLPNVWK